MASVPGHSLTQDTKEVMSEHLVESDRAKDVNIFSYESIEVEKQPDPALDELTKMILEFGEIAQNDKNLKNFDKKT
jgi:hypothetical protein